MRPALQRLLSRPSSLELLRSLVGNPEVLAYAPATTSHQYERRKTKTSRTYASIAAAVQDEDIYSSRNTQANATESKTQNSPKDLSPYCSTRTAGIAPTESVFENISISSDYHGFWSQDEIDFESDLAAPIDPRRQRLLDQKTYSNNLQLFACLLEHRERRYGLEGIRIFWQAVKERSLILPTRGFREKEEPAEKLWTSFLKLGFYDNQVLEEICQYADDLLEKKGKRWPRLYAMIVQHFLVRGQGKEALAWHNRLLEQHPPTADSFAELCHQTVHHGGDLNALKEVYDKSEHCNAYGKIIPTLCFREDFKSALDWHFRLIRKGDIPRKPQHAQALSRFLAIYDQKNAVRVTKSLVAAGAAFDVPSNLNKTTWISREMMNLVHGRTFRIPVKTYNDEYGARWFATSWVPLDLAMHSIHALGIEEIGPLSLQALCLRPEHDGTDAQPKTILRRIERLQSIGISTGNSVYSRAVNHFAKTGTFNYLMDLLRSDQHPEVLENWKYLEGLLASYVRTRNWSQYRRILAIRTISSKSPTTDAQNVWLRTHLTNKDLPSALDILAKMQVNGTVVRTTTIAYLLETMLAPRQRGRKVQTFAGGTQDLEMATTVLKNIIDAGNVVPATYWREVIRRIGMKGCQKELNELCIYLASRYGPQDELHLVHRERTAPRTNIYRVPSQVNSRHPLHPLKILFPVSLQKAIVEWGFIHGLRQVQRAARDTMKSSTETKGLVAENDNYYTASHITAGISLLMRLYQLGVHIDFKAVRNAIFNRLVIYYGPGRSNRPYNRVAQLYAPELGAMIRMIDDAMGCKTFDDDLKLKIMSRGTSRLLERAKKEQSRGMRRLKSRVLSNGHFLL